MLQPRACLLLVIWLSQYVSNGEEYCQSDYFEPMCEKDEVLVTTRAKYGRIQTGGCVSENFGYIGCSHDVIRDVDATCSGRNNCKLRVDEKSFKIAKPCHKDLKSYLDAEYVCLKVEQVDKYKCPYAKQTEVVGQSGYISSLVTETTGCGSTSSPWVVRVQPGQVINVSILDFGVYNRSGPNQMKICRVLATIREKNRPGSLTVCGGEGREHHVYTSRGDAIEIRLLVKHSGQAASHFLIKYQAIGCPKIPTLKGGWVKREGQHAELGCHDKDKTWRLTCKGNRWHGKTHNCTSGKEGTFGGIIFGGKNEFPQGFAVVIIIGLALIVGSLILVFGLICLRWQRNKREAEKRLYESGDIQDPNCDVIIRPYAESSMKIYQETTPRIEINPKENEYSSMRLLPPLPVDAFGRPQPGYGDGSCTSGGLAGQYSLYRSGGSEHVYESPDSPKGLVGLTRSDSGPHYFDLDPQELAAVAKSLGVDQLDCGPGNIGYVPQNPDQALACRRVAGPQHQLSSADLKPSK